MRSRCGEELPRVTARLVARAVVILGVLAAPGCAYLIPQPPVTPRAAPLPGRLRAGAAKVALTPVARPVPLAGFGPRPLVTAALGRRVDGSPRHLHVRALSLTGESEVAPGRDRVVLVSVDALVVTAAMRRRVLTALGDEAARLELVVTATHTHEGIGGFWRGAVPEWASIGRYDAARTDRTVAAIASAVRGAIAAERPARLASGRASLGALVVNRTLHGSVVDPDLLALELAADDGSSIARAVVFASHPTELYGRELLSPAWPGACCDRLEAAGGVALVFQGGLGDQRPRFPPEVLAAIDAREPDARIARSVAYGEAVARSALEALAPSPRRERVVLSLASGMLALPPPVLGAVPIPLLDRAAAVPVVLRHWPERVRLELLRLDAIALGFAPFELVAETTLEAKVRLRALGFEDAALVSLADGWFGYAPEVPWPWTTSGAASFGGAGMGGVIGERLVAIGATVAPRR